MSLPLDELLATLGALAKDDAYNSASLEDRGDVVATMTDAACRARAERMWLQRETEGENPKWRLGRRAELLARGDARIRERAVELQRKAQADFTARREKAQLSTFTYTADPNLSQVENEKRCEEARRKHMSDPHRIAEAIRQVQRTQEGMLFNNPGQNAFEAEARSQIEAERPWLFAHLAPRSQGGSAARAATSARSVNDLANDLLERHPVHASKRTAAAMTLDRATKRYVPRACTAEEKALARDILETYRAHDALISGTPSMTQEQCAESLARAASSMGDKGPRFLATCMRAAGIR